MGATHRSIKSLSIRRGQVSSNLASCDKHSCSHPICLSVFLSLWAAAPKGTKSCRTQGTFVRLSIRPLVRPSVCPPPQALSGLKFALSGLKSALSGLKSTLLGLRGLGGGGQTDGQTNEQKSPVFYRTLSSSGPLPKNAEKVIVAKALDA